MLKSSMNACLLNLRYHHFPPPIHGPTPYRVDTSSASMHLVVYNVTVSVAIVLMTDLSHHDGSRGSVGRLGIRRRQRSPRVVLVDIIISYMVGMSYNVDEDSSKYCAGDCATILWILI